MPVTLSVEGRESQVVKVNQRLATTQGFASLGKFQLPQGRKTSVIVSNAGTDGFVVADAIQFVRVTANPGTGPTRDTK